MIFETKALSELSEADLNNLLSMKVPEGKQIDYKRQIQCDSDGDRKEFLFDVSSFANTSGGGMICGMDESGGVPVAMDGLDVANPDAEIRKLESIILSGIEPRIPGLGLRFIPISNGKQVLVIRVPKSWVLPHMVTLKGTNKFYCRNSAGKYPVDVGELRTLFELSSTVTEKIRSFRLERLARIMAKETPAPLPSAPLTILHVVPLQSFSQMTRIDLRAAEKVGNDLHPLHISHYNSRINIDGMLHYTGESATAHGYLQLFGNGITETVNASLISANAPLKLIPSTAFRSTIIQHVGHYLSALSKLQVYPPFVIMLTLTGVKGYGLAVKVGLDGGRNIDRDVLNIPELILEKADCNPQDLRPIFDSVWNAAGFTKSPDSFE